MSLVTAMTKDQIENCPIRQVLAKVTGKWQMLIFLALKEKPMRFGALKRAIGDVTQRVLTQNLRSLERDGYLTRTVATGAPVSVTYALTDRGRDLTSLLTTLAAWAVDHHADIAAHRTHYDEAT